MLTKITNVNLSRLGNVPENIAPQLLILENDQTVTKEKGQVARNKLHSCVGHSIQSMMSYKTLVCNRSHLHNIVKI